MSPENEEAGGSGNTPPGAPDPAALQTKLAELQGQLTNLEAQYTEAQKRSAGKDKVITEKTQQVDDVLGRLGALESEMAAEVAKKDDQVKRLLAAAGSFEELVKQSQGQAELLQAELAKQKAETARLTAVSKAGIAPGLVDLVPSSEDPAVLEAAIKKIQEAQAAIANQTKEDMAKFMVLPGGAPPPAGQTGVVANLDEQFGKARTQSDLLAAAAQAAGLVAQSGLEVDGESWMAKTRRPLED